MTTLTKYGVPMGGGTGRGGLTQLKYSYRYRVRVIGFGPIAGGIEFSQQVQTCGRPSVSHDKITVHSYNSQAHFAGKHSWDPISISLKDDVTNSITRLVGHQMQKQLNHFEQTGYLSGINYKFTTLIEIMDGGNDVVIEAWTLEGCFVESFEFSGLDYSQSDFATIDLNISYDNATMADGLMTQNPDFIPGFRI